MGALHIGVMSAGIHLHPLVHPFIHTEAGNTCMWLITDECMGCSSSVCFKNNLLESIEQVWLNPFISGCIWNLFFFFASMEIASFFIMGSGLHASIKGIL